MTAKKATPVATLQPKTEMQAVHPGAMIQALMNAPEVDITKLTAMFELQTKFEENGAQGIPRSHGHVRRPGSCPGIRQLRPLQR